MGNVFGTLQGAGNLASTGNNILGAVLGPDNKTVKYWMDQLRPASYKGIPFGVLASAVKFGRKNVIHNYPLRDTVWVEDLGRAARRITMEGFLVENAAYLQTYFHELGSPSSSVIEWRKNLIVACEASGDGELIHPTLGRLRVSLLDIEVSEQWDEGRVFKIRFTFLEGGQRIFPGNTTSTPDDVDSKSKDANDKIKQDFAKRVAASLRSGAAAVMAAVNAVQKYSRMVQGLINDATNIKNLVLNAGSLLQAASGQSSGRRFSGGSVLTPTAQTPLQQRGAGSAAMTQVNVASKNLITSATALSGTTTDAFSSAVQTLVASALAAAVNPADGLRVMAAAAVFSPAIIPASDAVGININTVTKATADLCRRSAVIAMAQASSTYQPVSYDDAVNVRAWVTELIDAEIDLAGEQNEDATFNALFDLRTAVVLDLIARGGSMSKMVQFNTPESLPATVLAHRLYGDISRVDELVEYAKPIHPAFMPTTMRILSK